VAQVYRYYLQPAFLRFILDETAYLSERPGVHPPPLFTVTLLRPFANSSEVLKHDGSAGINDTTNNPFGQNVVTVTPKP
jgi:hypothetical protein